MNISDEAVIAAAAKLVQMRRTGKHSSYEYAQAVLEAAAPYIMSEALMAAAEEARIRGDVGKEDEGGITAWDFLAWRARQASGSAGAGE